MAEQQPPSDQQDAQNQGNTPDLQAQLETLTQERDAERATTETLRGQLAAAAGRYREAMVASNPGVPPRLIAGATIEELDVSLTQAQEIVLAVQQHAASQEKPPIGFRPPQGGGARTPPDLSSMSPKDKIIHGLNNP